MLKKFKVDQDEYSKNLIKFISHSTKTENELVSEILDSINCSGEFGDYSDGYRDGIEYAVNKLIEYSRNKNGY